jgi:hypothetical protein
MTLQVKQRKEQFMNDLKKAAGMLIITMVLFIPIRLISPGPHTAIAEDIMTTEQVMDPVAISPTSLDNPMNYIPPVNPVTVSGECWNRIVRVEVINRINVMPRIEMVEEQVCQIGDKYKTETLRSLSETYIPGDNLHDGLLYYLSEMYERKR